MNASIVGIFWNANCFSEDMELSRNARIYQKCCIAKWSMNIKELRRRMRHDRI